MIEGATHESRRRMAEVAIQGGRYMILRLTRGRHSVAGLTIIHNAGVIENRASESSGGMTYTAILISDNMPITLTLSKHTVVTRLTVINDPNVIECRG